MSYRPNRLFESSWLVQKYESGTHGTWQGLQGLPVLVAIVALIVVAIYLIRVQPTQPTQPTGEGKMGKMMTGSRAELRALSQPAQNTVLLKVDSTSGVLQPEPLSNIVAPAGTIAMWFKDALPVGWVFCNGSNGTPDFRGLFPLGWTPGTKDPKTSSLRKPIVTTGGSALHPLTENQMPKHSHTFANYKKREGNYVDNDNTRSCPDSGDWRDNRETQPAGLGEAHENMPPYVVVKYIMKL
jgi:microcystin-dependent protein